MVNIRHTTSALRALSALFLYRALQPALVMSVILLVAAFVTMILLALSFSNWWWLLLILLLPLTLIFVVMCYLIWFTIQKLMPRKLAPNERAQLQDFIESLFSIADRSSLPYPVLLFLVAKDVIRGKESRFLSSLIGDSKALTREFEEIQNLFR